jgi:hypothetical protein
MASNIPLMKIKPLKEPLLREQHFGHVKLINCGLCGIV